MNGCSGQICRNDFVMEKDLDVKFSACDSKAQREELPSISMVFLRKCSLSVWSISLLEGPISGWFLTLKGQIWKNYAVNSELNQIIPPQCRNTQSNILQHKARGNTEALLFSITEATVYCGLCLLPLSIRSPDVCRLSNPLRSSCSPVSSFPSSELPGPQTLSSINQPFPPAPCQIACLWLCVSLCACLVVTCYLYLPACPSVCLRAGPC